MRLFFVLFLLAISGCGFKLRGLEQSKLDLPSQEIVVSIESDDNYLRQQVYQQLKVNGINIVEQKDTKNTLHISRINVKSTQVALSNVNLTRANERQYRLLVTLINPKGEQLDQQTLKTTQLVETNDSRVLAGQESIRIADNQAKRSLVQKLLFFIHRNK